MLCIGLTPTILVPGKLVFILSVNNVSQVLINLETATSLHYSCLTVFFLAPTVFKEHLKTLVKSFSNIDNTLEITSLTKWIFYIPQQKHYA